MRQIDEIKDISKAEAKYVDATGDFMTGNLTFNSTGKGIKWDMNTDGAGISFKNNGDGDPDSYLEFITKDNGNEYFKFNQLNGSITTELMSIKNDGVRFKGTKVSLENHTHNFLPTNGGSINGNVAINGTISLPNNLMSLKFGDDIKLGDGNVANSLVLQGVQDSTRAGIVFGSNIDTNLYRESSHKLKTDSTFNAVGGLQWNGQNLDDRYFTRSARRISGIDFNTFSTGGFYAVSNNDKVCINNPAGSDGYLAVLPWNDTNWCSQIFINDIQGDMYLRTKTAGGINDWTSWARVYDTLHKPTWNEVLNKPSSYTPSSHTHSSIEGQNSCRVQTTGNNDYAGLDKKNNVNIDTWYGFSISNKCAQSVPVDGVAFSVNARNGQVWTRGEIYADSNRRVYHEGYKPSTNDIGAVAQSSVSISSDANKLVQRDGAADVNCRLLRANYGDEGSIRGAIAFRVNNSSDNYTRYCNNPESVRSWLNGVSKAGDTMTGNLNIQNGNPSLIIKNTSGGDTSLVLDRSNNANWRFRNSSGILLIENDFTSGKTSYFNVVKLDYNSGNMTTRGDIFAKNGSKVYHTNNKPTPSEIGAAASSHNHTSLNGITELFFNTNTSDGASIKTTLNSAQTYFDFNLNDDPNQDMWRWRFKPSGGNEFSAMELIPVSLTSANLHVSGNLYSGPNKVYHQGFKPTPSEIGALGKTEKAVSAGNADTVSGKNFTWDWGTGNPTHIWGSNGSETLMKVFDPAQIKVGKATIADKTYNYGSTYKTTMFYNPTDGLLIDFGVKEACSTMIHIKVTGNSYSATSAGPLDISYDFYDYTTGIINYSGITVGDRIDLHVFRHNGMLKAWLKPTSSYQSIQIEITSGTNSINPTVTGAVKPSTGIASEIVIVPYSVYHSNRKPTASDVGALSLNGGTVNGLTTFNTKYITIGNDKRIDLGYGATDVFIHNTLSKKYLALKDDGSLVYDSKNVALEPQKDALWTGSSYLSTNMNITPKKPLNQCQNGWILIFADNDPGVGTTNCNYVTHLVPKNGMLVGSGNTLFICPNNETSGFVTKAAYITNTQIKGASREDISGWNDVILRQVLEY